MPPPCETAVANGVQVSFDCNFRPSLWAGRESDARRLLAATARQADLLFANSADAELMFGLDTNAQPGAERLRALAAGLSAECPRLRWLAGTNRVVHGAGRHELSGFLVDHGSVVESDTLVLDGIVDRIGAGDAYAAGVLYGLSQAMAPQPCVAFATALAALKHSVPGDFIGLRAEDVLCRHGPASERRAPLAQPLRDRDTDEVRDHLAQHAHRDARSDSAFHPLAIAMPAAAAGPTMAAPEPMTTSARSNLNEPRATSSTTTNCTTSMNVQ